MDDFEDEEYEWQPPSDAEMKIIQARRERNNKISKLMGDYLLKGYKMLSTMCPACGTILLRDKQEKDYCISCNELDSDTDKDDPVVSQTAARSQVRESQRTSLSESGREIPRPDSPTHDIPQAELPRPGSPTCNPPIAQPHNIEGARSILPPPMEQSKPRKPAAEASSVPVATVASVNPNAVAVSCEVDSVRDYLTVASHALQKKIVWASQELNGSNSVEASIQLCTLIKSAAEAVKELSSINT